MVKQDYKMLTQLEQSFQYRTGTQTKGETKRMQMKPTIDSFISKRGKTIAICNKVCAVLHQEIDNKYTNEMVYLIYVTVLQKASRERAIFFFLSL